MDVMCYLPDEIGAKAKEKGLPFSQILRAGVMAELARQEAVMNTLKEPQTYEVEVETDDGHFVTGRITGKEIAEYNRSNVRIFLTDDERVLLYDEKAQEVLDVTQNPVEAFQGWFEESDRDSFVEAMSAIGEKAVIDL